MREIVHLQVGQCGNQIGAKVRMKRNYSTAGLQSSGDHPQCVTLRSRISTSIESDNQALKRRKLHEEQRQKIDDELSAIEMQREALEETKSNAAVQEALKNASEAQEAAQQHKVGDQVHDIKDDIAEQRNVAKEISQAIPKNLAAFGQDVDEDKVEREVEEILREQHDRELWGVGPSVDELPSTSTTDFAKRTPTKSKAAATQSSKGKKRCKKQLQQIDDELSAIEMQREALEEAKRNAAVLEAMKNASEAQEAAQQHKDGDQVHDIKYDIAEQRNVAKEISQAIPKNLAAFGQDVDEDKVEREVEEILREQHDRELWGVGPSVDELPSTSTTDFAKRTPTKRKAAATQASKGKKRCKKQLQQIDDELSAIEMQREALEEAKRNAAVLEAMKNASEAQEAAHQHKVGDQVHDIKDDIAEQRNVAKEISQAIPKNLAAFGQDVDEDKVEREVEEILQEQLDRELWGVGPSVDELPSTSTTDFAKRTPTKRKAAATQASKGKKRCKKQLQQIDDELSAIEMQREALEEAKRNAAVLEAMKNASEAQEAAQQHKDGDQVHDIKDDIAEQRNVAKEISEAIPKNLAAFGQDVDEVSSETLKKISLAKDKLEHESEELLQEQHDKKLSCVGTSVDELPSIPTTDNAKPTPTKSKTGKSKAAAILALKRKKLHEKKLQQIDDALSAIEKQREALEEAKRNCAVLETRKIAADAVKAAQQHMDVDQVHDIKDDIAEQRKAAANQALKGKKRCKKHLQQIDYALSAIKKQREALEKVKRKAVQEALKNASEAQEAAQQHKDVDQMRDIAEQRNVAKEISEAISNLAASGPDVYEDVLEVEPEEFLQELLHREPLDEILPVD